MRISIFKKIFIGQLALIVIASGVISLASFYFMVRLYNEAQNNTLRIVSSSTAAMVAAQIAEHKTTLKEITEARNVALYAQDFKEPHLVKHLERYQEQFPVLWYVNREGIQGVRLVKGQTSEVFYNLADQKVFKDALAAPNQTILGEIVLDPVLKTQTLQFAYAKMDFSNDQFLGLIIGQTPLDQFIAPSRNCASHQKGYCRIVDSQGNILSDPETKKIMQPLVLANQNLDQLFINAASTPSRQIHHDMLNGEDSYFAVSMIPGTSWLVISVLPSQQYNLVPRVFRNFSILLFLGLLLLAAIFTFFLAQAITSPIHKLVRASTAMAQGDFDQRVEAGNDELGDLTESFNTMAEKLGTAINREKQILAAEASARLKAELADQHKSEFLSKVSHELRTPLGIVLGMADLLTEDRLPDKSQAKLTAIKESGQNLLQLIDGILDFSRLEKGTMSLTPAPFDLYAILGRLKKQYEPIATAKGLMFFCEETALVPTTVVGDEGRIYQVLANLLDNAIKFTEHGDISLRVRPLGLKAIDDQHLIHLRFEVADTGCGIPLEQQTAMFDSFNQLAPDAARTTSGLGIGLTISQQLVELMQGKIGMKSAPGKGSTFFVDLDLPVAKEGYPPPAFKPSAFEPVAEATDQHNLGKSMNILVAEDNPVNQKLVRLMLEMRGHKVRIATDGKEVVAIFQNEAVDLILMDVQMPGMNGFDATAIIRDLEKNTGGHVPIIAVTAHVMPGYKEECFKAGMDNYLSKPFRMQELFTVIEKTLAQLNSPA